MPLGNGQYEIGVHIADVSHFIELGYISFHHLLYRLLLFSTALDKEALNRATTVYLVQKAIPMLPRLLCEELCSLNSGVDRLAFSVIWIFDSNAKIIGKPWFGKTVIRSCAKLSYDHAQCVIEQRDWSHLPIVNLHNVTYQDVASDILQLYDFSLKLRKVRDGCDG